MRQIVRMFIIPLIAVVALQSTALAGGAPPPYQKTFQDGETGPLYPTQDQTVPNENKLKLVTSSNDKLTIHQVWVWNKWLDRWDDITANCTIPGGSNDDPVITLPTSASQGDKFKVSVTAEDGPDLNNNTVTVTPDFTT